MKILRQVTLLAKITLPYILVSVVYLLMCRGAAAQDTCTLTFTQTPAITQHKEMLQPIQKPHNNRHFDTTHHEMSVRQKRQALYKNLSIMLQDNIESYK